MKQISFSRNLDCVDTSKERFANTNKVRSVVRRSAMIATLLMAMAGAGLAQVPTRAQIYFDINVPFALTLGGYNLPPGHYVLYQESQNPNLFHLYQHDLAREPVAVVYAIRGHHWERRSGGTRIEMAVDESGDASHLVLRGFRVPFDDSWEVISVRVKKSALMSVVK